MFELDNTKVLSLLMVIYDSYSHLLTIINLSSYWHYNRIIPIINGLLNYLP